MKNLVLSIMGFWLIFGCKKDEKICSNLPEGIYKGSFTDIGTSETHYNNHLTVSFIDNNTVSINALPSSQYTLNRVECKLNGKITAIIGSGYKDLDVTGNIKKKKGKYIIEGTYTYLGYSGGLGNPNYYDVLGNFEIKQ